MVETRSHAAGPPPPANPLSLIISGQLTNWTPGGPFQPSRPSDTGMIHYKEHDVR